MKVSNSNKSLIPSNNEIINKKLKDENKNLKIKNEELSNKLSLLKSNIKELKVQLDNTIYAQLDSKQKKVEDLSMQLGINKSKINSLNKALKFYEDNYMKQKTLRNKYFSILTDKLKNENFYLTQENIIKELKEKNKKLRNELSDINSKLSTEEGKYLNIYNNFEEKKRNFENLQKNLNNIKKESEKSSEILNQKIQELYEIKSNVNKMKSETEDRKKIEKGLKRKLEKVNESNKYMSSFIQENSIQDTSTSFIIKQHQLNTKKLMEEINGVDQINNESAISNLNKQAQNDVTGVAVTGTINTMYVNNKENSIGTNGNEQSKLNEAAEDDNMKEISGIMKSILED